MEHIFTILIEQLIISYVTSMWERIEYIAIASENKMIFYNPFDS